MYGAAALRQDFRKDGTASSFTASDRSTGMSGRPYGGPELKSTQFNGTDTNTIEDIVCKNSTLIYSGRCSVLQGSAGPDRGHVLSRSGAASRYTLFESTGGPITVKGYGRKVDAIVEARPDSICYSGLVWSFTWV